MVVCMFERQAEGLLALPCFAGLSQRQRLDAKGHLARALRAAAMGRLATAGEVAL